MKRMDEDDTSALLKKILSPADAQSLVRPPPDHAPHSGPSESTPLTGNLAAPPSQATPSRDDGEATPRTGLAAWFAEQGRSADRAADPQYVKVSSQGQVGYLPRANLARAQQIDRDLKVLEA
jgi:hypothetical protein